MKKFMLAILLLLPVAAFAGSGTVATDRWDNRIGGVPFAPYSTTWKIFTGGTKAQGITAATFTFDANVLGVQFECTVAGTAKLNSQSIGIPVAANTKYQVLRNMAVSKIIFTQPSSATHNVCRITMF